MVSSAKLLPLNLYKEVTCEIPNNKTINDNNILRLNNIAQYKKNNTLTTIKIGTARLRTDNKGKVCGDT
ncbi:hypothetical protein GCM10009430_35380 [Aquimarina litoralis]|uniref:Uncharacterized protein n=1 Tax=Aquimarina litoralis TaxID=584605 RepID=A0ABP3U8Z9_9FLAO